MGSNASRSSSSDTILVVAALIAFIAGGLLGLSSLFGARWWVNLIVVLLAAVAVAGMFESDPDVGIVVLSLLCLFALYGFISTLGWFGTLAILVISSGVVLLLASDSASVTPQQRSTARSGASTSPLETTSEQTLLRYAREYLDGGGERATKAVVSALRARIAKEHLRLGPNQDLSWIASRALSSTRPVSTPPPSPAPVAPHPTIHPPAGERIRSGKAPAANSPASERRPSARTHLHEFGSFEIERVITRILEDTPSATDEDLIDRVLASLDITDRSAFALERLTDAIERVRGTVPRSKEERRAVQREQRLARVPTRHSGGRTKLYEYGSHEIERVVEELLAVESELTEERLHEEVVRVLGIEDPSNLARERIAHAAAKVSSSPYRPGAAARARRSPPKKKAAKKATKKTAAKKTAKKPTKKTAAKKTGEPRRAAQEKTSRTSTVGPAVGRETTKTSDRGRRPAAETPSPESEQPRRQEESGAPGVKDIADLLGF